MALIFHISSKKTKLIIIGDQVAAYWKMQRNIAFFRDKFSVIVDLSPLLMEQKHGFNQEAGINQTRSRAQRTPGARKR